jgi:hypothetical protein
MYLFVKVPGKSYMAENIKILTDNRDISIFSDFFMEHLLYNVGEQLGYIGTTSYLE